MPREVSATVFSNVCLNQTLHTDFSKKRLENAYLFFFGVACFFTGGLRAHSREDGSHRLNQEGSPKSEGDCNIENMLELQGVDKCFEAAFVQREFLRLRGQVIRG